MYIFNSQKLPVGETPRLTGCYAMPGVTLFFWLSPSQCYLEDAMPCQWSSSSFWWSTASATDLRERLLSGVFYLTLLPASMKASLGAGSSTLMLAGLHADLRNIAPARLLNHSNPQTLYYERFSFKAYHIIKTLLVLRRAYACLAKWL